MAEEMHPGDFDPSQQGVYYYSDGGALRVVTDDGDLWLAPSLSEELGVFLAVGDSEEGEYTFLLKPELLGAIGAYLEVFKYAFDEYLGAVGEVAADGQD